MNSRWTGKGGKSKDRTHCGTPALHASGSLQSGSKAAGPAKVSVPPLQLAGCPPRRRAGGPLDGLEGTRGGQVCIWEPQWENGTFRSPCFARGVRWGGGALSAWGAPAGHGGRDRTLGKLLHPFLLLGRNSADYKQEDPTWETSQHRVRPGLKQRQAGFSLGVGG